MKFFVVIFLIAVLVFLVSQIFGLNKQRVNYQEQLTQANVEAGLLEEKNQLLKKDLDFFQAENNLAKELRARFNYRVQGEKLLILVPPSRGE